MSRQPFYLQRFSLECSGRTNCEEHGGHGIFSFALYPVNPMIPVVDLT